MVYVTSVRRVDLKYSCHMHERKKERKKDRLWEVMGVFINLIVATISQCIYKLNLHILHLLKNHVVQPEYM